MWLGGGHTRALRFYERLRAGHPRPKGWRNAMRPLRCPTVGGTRAAHRAGVLMRYASRGVRPTLARCLGASLPERLHALGLDLAHLSKADPLRHIHPELSSHLGLDRLFERDVGQIDSEIGG